MTIWWVDVQGDAAKNLEEIGIPASDSLIESLTNHERVIAAHLLLWRIWRPQELRFHIQDREVPFTYRLGELHWNSRTREHFDISEEMLLRNQEWWRTYVEKHTEHNQAPDRTRVDSAREPGSPPQT